MVDSTVRKATKAQCRYALVASALLVLCIRFPANAQTAVGDAAVVRPTDNGFEELIRAGDASLDNSATTSGKIIADAESDGATLTQKRAAVHEAAFRNALSALRDSLGRPIRPKPQSLFKALVSMRRLSQMLAIEQYVLLSDGKVPTALDSFADSLALCDTVESWSQSGIVYGQVIEDRAIKTLSPHLDQLSQTDCGHLFALLTDRLNAPNPALAGLQAMIEVRKTSIAALGDKIPPAASDAELALAFDSGNNNDPNALTIAVGREIVRIRTQDPGAWARFQSDADSLFTAEFNGIADRIANGSPEPLATATASVQTPAGGISSLAEKVFQTASYSAAQEGQMVDGVISSRARLQLLAVHAAILKWRWESNAVPPSLSVLRLGSLANDPFSGGALVYSPVNARCYTLSSIGPLKRDDDYKPVAGAARLPLLVDSPTR